MKTIKIHLKIAAFLISLMILMQGCTVYKSSAATLDEAHKSQNKVKVTTSNNESIKFNSVDFIDSEYYGISKQENDKVLLDENKIKLIRLKNKTLSTIVSIGTPIVLGGLIYLIVAAAQINNMDLNISPNDLGL